MRVFHRTPEPAAILEGGFKDGTGTYMMGVEVTGVWVSDVPLDINCGAKGDTVLAVEIPEAVFVENEVVEEGKGYREAVVPVAVLNASGKPTIFDHDYAGCTREELLGTAAGWEESMGPNGHSEEIRRAVAFFDAYGYMRERSE